MYIRIIIQALLVILASLLQFSFIPGLPLALNNFNLILIILIFILSLGGLKLSMWWAVGIGFLLDIFSFSPFGVFLASLPLTMLAANFLMVQFFTNRSLYSFFALTFLTTIFYNVFLNLINYLAQIASYKSAIFSFNRIFLVSLGEQIILNLFAVLIIFYVINFISDKWKPVFLAKH